MNDSDFDAIYDDCDEVWEFDLLTASAVGDEESVVHLLKQEGLDQVGLKNSRGWTPIMFSSYFGHSHLVSILMANKSFNVRDKNDKGLFQKHFLTFLNEHEVQLTF